MTDSNLNRANVNQIKELEVQNIVRTRIPTQHGAFMLYYYRNSIDNKEHIALVKGSVGGASDVPVRVHSECFTGDVLGSRRCDCRDQLHMSMSYIGSSDCGILIYLRQEGRGIGLLEKLKAYNLQDQGLDTVDANIQLGHRADERSYNVAALILKDLDVKSLRLMTNNPAKISQLQELGIQVDGRVPVEVPHHDDNADYLKTKVEKMDHLLSLGKTPYLPEDFQFLQPLIGELARHAEAQLDKPFVTISYAQSIDGSIAVHRSESISLSCEKSLKMTHALRSHHDALLVGINTILIDDPQLNVRYFKGKNPQPVILDSRLRFPIDSKLLSPNAKPPIIITTELACRSNIKPLEDQGARIYTVKSDAENKVDLPSVLNLLASLGLKTVMVEGGASVIGKILASESANYCIVTIAPRLIGGLKAIEEPCRPQNTPPITIVNCEYHRLDTDIIVYGSLGKN